MVSSYLYPAIPEPYTHAAAGRQVTEAATLSGLRVLPDRDTLVNSVDPAHTGEVIATSQLSDATATMRRIGQHGADDLTATAAHLYDRLVDLSMHGQALPEDEAADLVTALMLNTGTRDHLISLAVRDATTGDVNAMISGLTRLVGRTPNHYVPAVGMVLAMGAYRSGDGALANVVMDRVMHVDPGYSLALLLASAMSVGLPPEMLDTLVLA